MKRILGMAAIVLLACSANLHAADAPGKGASLAEGIKKDTDVNAV